MVLGEVQRHGPQQTRFATLGHQHHDIAAPGTGHGPAEAETPHEQHHSVEAAERTAQPGNLSFVDVDDVSNAARYIV